MEKTQKSGEGVKTSAKLADEAAERRERMERLECKIEKVLYYYFFNLKIFYSNDNRPN